jgi:hypothetical protein
LAALREDFREIGVSHGDAADAEGRVSRNGAKLATEEREVG